MTVKQPTSHARTLQRIGVLAYGATTYVFFFGTFCYAAGFVGNALVPKSIDSGVPGGFAPAIAINVALLSLFALQHSVMARPAFKRWWTRFVPQSIERSTYVLATNIALVLLFAFWQPMTGTVWSVANPIGRGLLHAIGIAGWGIVLLSTLMIGHFELFGLRQVWSHWKNRREAESSFRMVGFYKLIRHPIQAGFLIAFWATPDMTAGHLLFAAVTTAYIVVALKFFEEPDLAREFGEQYADYRRRVPMLFPTGRHPS